MSYEYNSPIVWDSKQLLPKRREEIVKNRDSSTIWIVFDFAPFHGAPGTVGARTFLYIDGHVATSGHRFTRKNKNMNGKRWILAAVLSCFWRVGRGLLRPSHRPAGGFGDGPGQANA